MRYFGQNKRTIDTAFYKLSSNKDKIIERGFPHLLQDCALYALASHDSEHHLHVEWNDFYGWALLKHGKEVARWSNKPDHHGRIDAVVHAAPKSNWVGIVIAGMRSYYSEEYEINILNLTRDEFVRNYWQKYITPLGLD
jgi:hypothetical protein